MNKMVLFTADKDRLEGLVDYGDAETAFENELGWLCDSGIYPEQIYHEDHPLVQAANKGLFHLGASRFDLTLLLKLCVALQQMAVEVTEEADPGTDAFELFAHLSTLMDFLGETILVQEQKDTYAFYEVLGFAKGFALDYAKTIFHEKGGRVSTGT